MKGQDPIERLNKLLKARLETWMLLDKTRQPQLEPLVTITQEPGCGAESIAEKLCSELGLHLYDWELVEQIAKDQQVSAQIVAALEKNPPSHFADFLAELKPEPGLTSGAYIDSINRILPAIAVVGNAVVMGRFSNFFFHPDRHVGLCFIAPLALRTKKVMKELGMTEKEARKHIASMEAEQQRLVKEYFQADIRDPAHYHLVINIALVTPDTIVQLVKALVPTGTAGRHDPSQC